MFDLIWPYGSTLEWMYLKLIKINSCNWNMSFLFLLENQQSYEVFHITPDVSDCVREKTFSGRETFLVTMSSSSCGFWELAQKAGTSFKVINQPGLL